MARPLVMPKLGAEMTAGVIVEWVKREGAWVMENEIVAIIETDKITYEVPSPFTGYLHILKDREEEIPVSVPIALVCETEEELREVAAQKMPAAAGPSPQGLPESAEEIPVQGGDVVSHPCGSTDGRVRGDVRISPLARNLASQQGLDIYALRGTGPGGRIKKRDVLRAMNARSPASAAPAAAETTAGRKTVKEVIALKGRRKVIAERLHDSLQSMAQFTDMGEMDVTELVAFRRALIDQEEKVGVRISYIAIILKVAALGLREMPRLNASLIDREIHVWNEINVGMAVDVEEGLIVPVIHNADQKSIVQIQHRLNDLTDRARQGRLSPDEIAGGTMTISNFGSYGSYYGTPILNPPEAILLGIGVIRQAPVVLHGEMVVRWVMTYTLTMDHRLVDGAKGGRFMNRIREILSAPSLLGVMG